MTKEWLTWILVAILLILWGMGVWTYAKTWTTWSVLTAADFQALRDSVFSIDISTYCNNSNVWSTVFIGDLDSEFNWWKCKKNSYSNVYAWREYKSRVVATVDNWRTYCDRKINIQQDLHKISLPFLTDFNFNTTWSIWYLTTTDWYYRYCFDLGAWTGDQIFCSKVSLVDNSTSSVWYNSNFNWHYDVITKGFTEKPSFPFWWTSGTKWLRHYPSDSPSHIYLRTISNVTCYWIDPLENWFDLF